MPSLISFFGSGLFFAPFIYVFFYLIIERNFNQYPVGIYLLKVFTVFGGLSVVIYACTVPSDLMVLMPSRGGAKNYVPASIFLVIVGVATITLPLYSKYIKFSNSSN